MLKFDRFFLFYAHHEFSRAFFQGVTASYVGISETVIQFVLYEELRSSLLEVGSLVEDEEKRNKVDFINFMLAGGSAKFFACVAAYPHGKIFQSEYG